MSTKSSTIGRLHSQETTGRDGEKFLNRYIVLNKNIEVRDTKTGNVIVAAGSDNRIINLYDAENSVMTLREKNIIDEKELEEQLNFINTKGVKFKLVRKLV